MLWTVTATRIHTRGDGWARTQQVPTFFIDSNVQGFTDEEGALKVARAIVGRDASSITVSPA